MNNQKKVAIYINPKKSREEIVKQIKDAFILEGFLIDDNNPDIVVFVGGDGTLLKAIHQFLSISNKTFFVGLNAGNLGYFYDFKLEELNELIQLLKNNELRKYKYNLLKGTLYKNNKKKIVYGVNEIRIENPFKTLRCEVYVDELKLEDFSGNGLLVCSSLGSSGYNKSVGGSLIDNELKLLQLSEISPIRNAKYSSLGSSLVLPKGKKIYIKGDISKCVIGYDAFVVDDNNFSLLEIELSNKYINILRPKSYKYINSIKRSFVK